MRRSCDDHERIAQGLQHQFPQATRGECERFSRAFPARNAAERLDAYLAWRRLHHLDDQKEEVTSFPSLNTTLAKDDATDWLDAMNSAIRFHGESNKGLSPDASPTVASSSSSSLSSSAVDGASHLPPQSAVFATSVSGRTSRKSPLEPSSTSSDRMYGQVVFVHDHSGAGKKTNDGPTPPDQLVVDLKGNVVVQVLPARLDIFSHPNAAQVYATALALYFDRKVDRNKTDQFALFVDVRPGSGWPNQPAHAMVGFVREVVHVLYDLYPGRLYSCMVVPVPRAAVYLWKLFQFVVNARVRQVMVLIPGPANEDSILSVQHLQHYMDLSVLHKLEQFRCQKMVK